jgi:hypothetical protein
VKSSLTDLQGGSLLPLSAGIVSHQQGNTKQWRYPAAVLWLALLTQSVWAWGPMGHRVAARFAEERLTLRALAAVHQLLGPGVTISDASVWADEEREIPGSQSWHYVNVPITAPRYDPRFCQPGGCVVSRIEYFKRILADKGAPNAERQQALKFLIHLIADLHQPLHVGDNNDRGGNLLQVRFFDIGSNLHRVWDSGIIEHHTMNEQVWLWDLTFVANPKMVVEWSRGTPEDWATESLLIAKSAYRLPGSQTIVRPGTRLGAEYCNFALPIIQRQLAKAGIRTAFILNGILN